MGRVTVGTLIDWWRRRRLLQPRYVRMIRVANRSDLPREISRRAVVVIGSDDKPKWAMLHCPCGRGHVVELNLSAVRRPRWDLDVEHGRTSLSPSVNAVYDGHRCHFWLRR